MDGVVFALGGVRSVAWTSSVAVVAPVLKCRRGRGAAENGHPGKGRKKQVGGEREPEIALDVREFSIPRA